MRMSSGRISGVCRKGTFAACAVVKELPRGFSVEPVENAVLSGQMLDTFDGVMRKNGRVLLQAGKRLHLIHLQTGNVEGQDVSGDWKFARELEIGPVRFQCLEKSRLRAFMPVAKLVVHQECWKVCDEVQKTVTRLNTVELVCNGRKTAWVSGEALRGYESETEMVFRALEKTGFVPAGVGEFPISGNGQDVYSSKPVVNIEAERPIIETANRIVLTFLDVARRNEAGAVDDVDTEFLHDYRVSLRRVRSLISLFKNVYAADFAGEMKTELAGVMKRTNRLRDLDVYLLDRKNYYALVPESMHAGLDIMFGVFEGERALEQQKVAAFFQTPEYDRRMNRIGSNFRMPEECFRGSRADMPSLKFAKRVMLKRYGRIVEIAGVISESTPDAAVHELRIQCKKLRYLMEFFAPLFSAKKIKGLIKSLKGLQDVLGRFNDYSVQREALSVFVKEHPLRGKKGLLLAESAGALVATLFQLQLQARREVEKGLEGFANPDTGRAFEALFSEG